MKLNTLLMSATLATASMFTATAYADSTTRVAAASALGSVAGTAIGKNMGGTTGATIAQHLVVQVVQQLQVTNVIVLNLLLAVRSVVVRAIP